MGRLTFPAGERVGLITVTINDNLIPESDKQFQVQLLNPGGGASVGIGSIINITIKHSDQAYGIFELAESSRSVKVKEEQDFSVVELTVSISGASTFQY